MALEYENKKHHNKRHKSDQDYMFVSGTGQRKLLQI